MVERSEPEADGALASERARRASCEKDYRAYVEHQPIAERLEAREAELREVNEALATRRTQLAEMSLEERRRLYGNVLRIVLTEATRALVTHPTERGLERLDAATVRTPSADPRYGERSAGSSSTIVEDRSPTSEPALQSLRVSGDIPERWPKAV